MLSMRSIIAIKLLLFFIFFQREETTFTLSFLLIFRHSKSVLKISSLKNKIEVYSKWQKSRFKNAGYKSSFNIYL